MASVFTVSENLSQYFCPLSKSSCICISPQMFWNLYFSPTFHLLLCLRFIQAWLAAFYCQVGRGRCICRQSTLCDSAAHFNAICRHAEHTLWPIHCISKHYSTMHSNVPKKQCNKIYFHGTLWVAKRHFRAHTIYLQQCFAKNIVKKIHWFSLNVLDNSLCCNVF